MPNARYESALIVNDLCKSYQGIGVLHDICFEVGRGECFALLGPNGAGKTTTMEICEGLTAAESGDVHVLGMTWKYQARDLRERIGVQLQETLFGDKQTVAEVLALFRSFFRRGLDVEALIAIARLQPKRHARVGALSGGQKQRLALACALAGNPDFLFLDEPTSGLDPQSRRQLWQLVRALKREGRTILLTTHYMEEAEALCDRVAFLDRGRIVACGTPRELIEWLGGVNVVEAEIDVVDFDDAALRAVAGVRGVHRTGSSILVHANDLHHALPAILVAFYRQSVRLRSLRTRSASLDDVFVALTGRRLSDA